ncbi:MAG: hypothetical protein IPM54_44455 [Polyangiaceae bacterium]|nr:hypothetical protein [Polyangiaceae bacterium]
MSDSHEPPQGRAVLQLVESRAAAQETTDRSALEPRMLAAWREWLGALASDADAALAAADLYAGLAPDAREAWLDALAEDGPSLSVPLLALYAPLLGVEADPDRRARMEMAMAMETNAERVETRMARALAGMTSGGARVVALIQPVYLQFVRVLWCRYIPDEGIFWARHDSLLADAHAPRCGDVVDGVTLETTPLPPIVEELAHAILAHRRRKSELPGSLREFADLFDTDVEAIDGTV